MSETDPRHKELVEWLNSQGHDEHQISLILAKLAEYDNQTLHESLFDSISNGNFDIASLIEDALADES